MTVPALLRRLADANQINARYSRRNARLVFGQATIDEALAHGLARKTGRLPAFLEITPAGVQRLGTLNQLACLTELADSTPRR
jgi:hypothetical protein